MASRGRHPLLSYQPFRFLFQLSYVAIVVARLPYYVAVALLPALRPNPTWSAKQTFMTRLVSPVLDATSRIGITETLTLEAGKEGARFQTVPPSTLDAYRGPAAHKTVKPATIGGTWFPEAPAGDGVGDKTVFLYFHGGAFVQGDGRDATCKSVAAKLLEKGGADVVFSVQYRLSGHGNANNPFPAALQDAISSYLFLVNGLGIPARQIVVAGDSSGGNLATALLRYLHEFEVAIGVSGRGQPKCAVLLSSWVAPFEYDMKDNPHCGTDFIPSSYPAWGAHRYAGHLPPADAASNPYITPLGNPFPTPVPIAHAGTAELFCERITRWADEMRGVEGNVVELCYEEGAVHDTFLVGELLGFERSAWEVAAKIGEFVGRF
ncbi:Uu.00g071220.m01.CDS01 [Anthostomella pinea]|uniref:Uu.00g071220.m01.CDS01 n=1 Tax=Anthostomella pinea TaxID=933095 RepID=A0AAI8VUV0_9PEZI|nr:Uu.00g071220.m01.CDS01 [Anthostomella pinea]